jgi:AcrR family transcriptional regulator
MYKEQTRLDLALAAFEQAKTGGLGAVRIPQVAAAAGVSTRTFNNYFNSKEQAIAWLAGQHASGVGAGLRKQPAGEPLGKALVAAVLGQYDDSRVNGLPSKFLHDFRALVAREPALHGEYLSAMAAAERDLGDAIAAREPGLGELPARVTAAMVMAAERAGVRHWMRTREGSLVATVRAAVEQAVVR